VPTSTDHRVSANTIHIAACVMLLHYKNILNKSCEGHGWLSDQPSVEQWSQALLIL
jgi:hypothetical protein